MSMGPLCVLLGEVSIQVFCQVFIWIVCLKNIEHSHNATGKELTTTLIWVIIIIHQTQHIIIFSVFSPTVWRSRN